VNLDDALHEVAAFSVGDGLEGLKQHLRPEWIEEALAASGTVTLRRRRLPAEQVIWMVIGMGLIRNRSIEDIVDKLELALPDKKGTLVAKSAISKARQRVGEDPLAYLFAATAAEWATRSADANRWRGLALYGLDGTTMRVADSPENRAAFGSLDSGLGRVSGYPIARIVAMMALRSHVLSAFRFADCHTGEITLARDIWHEVPEQSLVIVDRNFLVKNDLIDLETSGERHWLSRTKANTKWAIVEKLGRDDYLVAWDVHHNDGGPNTWTMRAIHYQRKGCPRATLLTSLVDAEKYPAKELIELYHERWETEIGYDELKTHLLDRQEAIRSKTPAGVRQELWGIALAYNLVRVEIERVAAEAGVPPTRISFVASLHFIRDEFQWLSLRTTTPGSIPSRLAMLRQRLKRLILPPRRPERSYPRKVKLKMSNYDRNRPSLSRPK